MDENAIKLSMIISNIFDKNSFANNQAMMEKYIEIYSSDSKQELSLVEINELEKYLKELDQDLSELDTRVGQLFLILRNYYESILNNIMEIYQDAANSIERKGIIDLPSDLSSFFVNNLNDSNANSPDKFNWISFIFYEPTEEDSIDPPQLEIKDDSYENTYPNNFYKLFTIEGYEKVKENIEPFYQYLSALDIYFHRLSESCRNTLRGIDLNPDNKTTHTDLAIIYGMIYNLRLQQVSFNQLVEYAPLLNELVITFGAMVEKYKKTDFQN